MLIALLEVGILEVKYMKMKLCALLAAIGLCAGSLSGCGGKTPAAADTSAAAKSSVGNWPKGNWPRRNWPKRNWSKGNMMMPLRQKTPKTRSQAAAGMR